MQQKAKTITIISEVYRNELKNARELDNLLTNSKIKSWKLDLENNLIINWKSYDESLYKRIINQIIN